MVSTKFNYEDVKNFFEENGCTLLESAYINARTPMSYICVCGNQSSIRLDDFKKGKRCRNCMSKFLSDRRKLTVDDVYPYFEERGYQVVSSFTKGKRQYFDYVCPNGHDGAIVFYSFKAGNGCKQCASEQASERYRLSYEQVKKEFEKQGCVLISTEYRNFDSPLEYKCSCGNISVSYISAIRKGIKCGCQYPRGDNSPKWNPNLSDEDRKHKRIYPEYKDWVKAVYERDQYTCQRCQIHGTRLNAHHIESYAENKELRTELSNGITLCVDCHRAFHSKYGVKGFNKQDLHKHLTDFI